MTPRYVVTELEGLAITDSERPNSRSLPGLSCMVVDTAYCYRVVGTWRTEDYGGARDRKRALVRHRAASRAAELNGDPPPPPFPTTHFRPT